MFKNVYSFESLNDASQNCIKALNNKDLLNKKQILKIFRNINNQLIKNNIIANDIINNYYNFNNFSFRYRYEYHHVVLCKNNANNSCAYDENFKHYEDDRPDWYSLEFPTAEVYRIFFYTKKSLKYFFIFSLKEMKINKEEYLIIKNILLKTKLIHKRSLKNV